MTNWLRSVWRAGSHQAGVKRRIAASGMLLGAVAVATGVILDCVAIVPRSGGMRMMLGYLQSPAYWVALALVFAGCALVGVLGARESRLNLR